MIGVVANPELAPDHRRHPLGGPDVAAEAERLGALRQQQWQLLPLLGRQPRGRARRHAPPQRRDPALAGTPHPLADRARRHPESVGDGLLAPVLLLQLPGAQPPPFAPVARFALFCGHASDHRTSHTTFSN
jgi:hypothetical protein